MAKAIYSKVNLSHSNSNIAKEFKECVSDIIFSNEVQSLKNYTQHMYTSRFQHCLNVSYYSFIIARKLGLDAYSAARAGLLHDLYYYDWKTNEDRPYEGNHAKIHPIIALENTKNLIYTNEDIEDAILHHMWPLKTSHPSSKIGWIVQACDKYCALLEIYSNTLKRIYNSKNMYLYGTIFTFICTR